MTFLSFTVAGCVAIGVQISAGPVLMDRSATNPAEPAKGVGNLRERAVGRGSSGHRQLRYGKEKRWSG